MNITCTRFFNQCVKFFDDWAAQDPKRALMQAVAFACNALVLACLIPTYAVSSTFVFCAVPVIILGFTLSTCLFLAYARHLKTGKV